MNKTFILFVLLIATIGVQAQIPNASFENWTTTGGYSTPDGWDNFNAVTAPSSVYTCEKGAASPPHGSAFLMLTTRTAGTTTLPGIAMTGKYDLANQTPLYGIPYAGRPAALTGWWQYMSMGTDIGRIAVYLTRWSTVNQHRDYVGGVEYDLPGMVMAWTHFSIPLSYNSGAAPDSVIVALVSSNKGGLTPGSYLYVDSLNFAGEVAGVPVTPDAKYSVTLWPNPATDRLSVDFGTVVTEEIQLRVADLYGRVVAVEKWKPGNRTYSLQLHPAAAGLYQVQLQVGDEVQTQRLLVQ